MGAVWFIFVIGLVNASLGFAIASYLGRRYRASIPPDWDFGDGLSWSDDPGETSSTDTVPDREPASEEVEETSAVEPVTDDGAGLPEEPIEPIRDSELIAESEMAVGDQEDGSHAASSETPEDLAMPLQTRVDTIVETASPQVDASMELSGAAMDGAAVSPDSKKPDGESAHDATALPGAAAGATEEAPRARPSSSAVESDLSPSARGEEADAAAAPLEVASQASHDDEVADALPRRPAIPSSGDKAIEAFLSEVGQYHEQLGQADVELRSQADDPDSDSIRACLESLLEASREFAEQREQARAGLGDVWGETSEFGVVRDRLNGAFGQQDAQIESTERAVAAFPYVDDLTQGCRVMIGETTKLMDANLRVRDTLREVEIELARGENRLTDLEPARLRDALTGAESREALEGALLQWMEGGDEHLGTLSVAAIDIDGFGRVNEEFGHAVGNQLLHALGKLLIAETGNRARLARYSGARFVLMFPDSNLRATTNAVERLRQIIELACFGYKNSEIRITVSCGVAEAVNEDTPDSVMARAEATLMEAKRYGRNRTFIHEGKYPTPVVPPKFPIEQRRMTL